MKRTRGFTLVELLVVIAIIGMLIAMLLPAVQSAREASRRSICSNNLRQLSMACLNVESRTHILPSGGWGYGWLGDPEGGQGYKQPGSWCYSILPDLEQASIFNITSDGKLPKPYDRTAPRTDQLQQSVVSTFYCPSRRVARAYPGSVAEHINFTSVDSVAKTDYAGSIGTFTGAVGKRNVTQFNGTRGTVSGLYGVGDTIYVMRGAGGREGFAAKSLDVNEYYKKAQDWPTAFFMSCNTGVIFAFSSIAVGLISDGVSNTFLLGEKHIDPKFYEKGNQIGSDDYSLYCGADQDSLRTTYCGTYQRTDEHASSTTFVRDENNARFPYRDSSDLNDEQSSKRFGSAHSGSLNMSLCDGSVQSVSYDIDWQVYTCKGDRADGMQASGADFGNNN